MTNAEHTETFIEFKSKELQSLRVQSWEYDHRCAEMFAWIQPGDDGSPGYRHRVGGMKLKDAKQIAKRAGVLGKQIIL